MPRPLSRIDADIASTTSKLMALRAERRSVHFRWGANSPQLAKLKEAYLDDSKTVDDVAASFKTNRGALMRLARVHNWPRRNAKLAIPLKLMTPDEKRAYNRESYHRSAGAQ